MLLKDIYTVIEYPCHAWCVRHFGSRGVDWHFEVHLMGGASIIIVTVHCVLSSSILINGLMLIKEVEIVVDDKHISKI